MVNKEQRLAIWQETLKSFPKDVDTESDELSWAFYKALKKAGENFDPFDDDEYDRLEKLFKIGKLSKLAAG